MGEEIKTIHFNKENRAKIKNRSAYMLPDNPSASGLNASQIKRTFYEPLLMLFDLLSSYENYKSDEKDGINNKIQDILDELTSHRLGLLRVGNYNKYTGEIEIIFDPQVVDLLSYDEETGMLTLVY